MNKEVKRDLLRLLYNWLAPLIGMILFAGLLTIIHKIK